MSPSPSGGAHTDRGSDSPRTVAIVQARMGSARLPGKVLADIGGRPMLQRILDRMARTEQVHETVVATTRDPEDEPIVALCNAQNVSCIRGDATDVLDRYHQAAAETQAEVIVRITGDCPLIDPQVVDLCVRAYVDANPPVDLVVNRLPWRRTFPIGLDTEVFGRGPLEIAWREAKEPHQREHVVPFLYENLDRFSMIHLQADGDYGSFRWTVDERQDLEAIRQIYEAFGGRDDFGWHEVLDLVGRSPELTRINKAVSHKSHRDVG